MLRQLRAISLKSDPPEHRSVPPETAVGGHHFRQIRLQSSRRGWTNEWHLVSAADQIDGTPGSRCITRFLAHMATAIACASLTKCHSMDQHQRLSQTAKSQRSDFGEETAVSCSEPFGTSVDATSLRLAATELTEVSCTDVSSAMGQIAQDDASCAA